MNGLSRRREARKFKALRTTEDPILREELVEEYLPLARHTARRFQRNGQSGEDLFQVACYGLVKAVDGFDPDRGIAFTSYAVPTIAGELKRYARDTGWGMRVPRGLQERVLDVDQAVTALTPELGRSPTPGQIAEVTGLAPEEVLEALEAGSNHSLDSLDRPVGGDADVTRIEALGAVDPGYQLVDDTQAVGQALHGLPARERMIIALRFGGELPQSEIARRLGVSQMHVSRLLRRTLDDLAEKVDGPVVAD